MALVKIACMWYHSPMSVDAGRKHAVQVNLMDRQIDALDAIAEREKKPDEEKGNRSRLIRRFVEEGIAREESKKSPR
jgi:hypothetical protein